MSVTLAQLRERAAADLAAARATQGRARDALLLLRQRAETTADVTLEETRAAVEARDAADTALAAALARVAELDRELAEDRRLAEAERTIVPTQVRRPAYDETVRTGTRTGPAASGAGRWVRADGRPAAVARGERWAAHDVVALVSPQRAAADAAVTGTHGGLGQFVRALSTGGGGSALVPTVWAGDVIDLARNQAAVLQAGAQLVPMDAKTVQIGRVTGDPTAGFRTEGSLITASDPTFDSVTLEAKTMSALVVGSLEWFDDADNADALVADAIAQAIGQQLDRVALFGGITTGNEGFNLATPPNPRGVLAALLAVAPSNILGAATNGTTQSAASYWNEVLDLLFTIRDWNEEPTALIWNSKAARQYAKAYDTTGQPLRTPDEVAAVPRLTTNQIPSFTAGTMTARATDVFAGDWSQLLIGQRLDLRLQVLTERYAENGQIGIVAHWRGDVQPARPRAFAAYRYLQGAL